MEQTLGICAETWNLKVNLCLGILGHQSRADMGAWGSRPRGTFKSKNNSSSMPSHKRINLAFPWTGDPCRSVPSPSSQSRWPGGEQSGSSCCWASLGLCLSCWVWGQNLRWRTLTHTQGKWFITPRKGWQGVLQSGFFFLVFQSSLARGTWMFFSFVRECPLQKIPLIF